MGIKRVVDIDFWKDDVVCEKYSAEDRYFFLYLLTNPNTKQCGIYHLSIRTISFEMGYTQDVVKVLIDRFQNKYKNIVYSYETNEIAILNFLKHSVIKGGKPVEDCIKKELNEVKDKKLIAIVYNHILDYMDEQIKYKKDNDKKSMYDGIKKVFDDCINIYNININNIHNDIYNDNDNERYGGRIVPQTSNSYKQTQNELNEYQFLEFWELYPKKQNKKKTEEWFKKNKPNQELFDLMIRKLKEFKETQDWKKENGKYVPLPTSWLNGKRWEDIIKTNTSSGNIFYDIGKEEGIF